MPSSLLALAHGTRRCIRFLVIAALAAVVLAGCAKDRSPDSAPLAGRSVATQLLGPDPNTGVSQWLDQQRHRGHLPYPLAIGNRWDYLIHTTTVMVTNAGPQPPESSDSPWLVVIGDAVVLEGRRYYVQSESDPRSMAPTPAALYYVRQDRTGLYERDLIALPLNVRGAPQAVTPLAGQLVESVGRMPAAAANPEAYRRAALELAQRVDRMVHPALLAGSGDQLIGLSPADLALLRYPLYVGAGWIVRDSPRFARRVTGREQLEVPAGTFAAWRIAGASELYGPNDRVTFWYGAEGLLRIQIHAELNATDNTGAIIGTVLFDSDQLLTHADLQTSAGIRGYSAEDVAEN